MTTHLSGLTYRTFKRALLPTAIALFFQGLSSHAYSAMLEEVIVTATKRPENAQDTAVTIQTIDSESLKALNIGDFDDYVRYLPGLTSAGRGPGRNDLYIRGVSIGKGGVKIAGAIGVEPNVALYLDETPISIGGRNIDLYMTDMSRVEVLPGPQGTLFGASSQAGTVRLITNKANHEGVSAGMKMSYETTSGGEPSNSLEAFINLPIIDDKLAARVAMYNVKEGGYIDNIPGTKSINNPAANPTQAATIANSQVAKENFNDAYYSGFRGSVSYLINDNWEMHAQHAHQELETEGVWDYDPELGDLKVQTFSPDNAEDVVDLSSVTVTGQLRDLELVYAGSFLSRDMHSVQDYSGYADAGPWIPYYICSYPGYDSCGEPELFVNQYFGVKRVTNEIRLSSDTENRVHFIVGAYTDDSELTERGDWNYPASVAQGFAQNAPIEGATASNPDARALGVTFFNDFIRNRSF